MSTSNQDHIHASSQTDEGFAFVASGDVGDSAIRWKSMISGPALILVPGVLFLATLIRSSFGFGEALVAVPLLALLLPIQVAAPIAVMVSITVALIVVVQDWRSVHTRSAIRLVLPTMLGIPLGLILLRVGAGPVVKGVLAALIIVFSGYSLLGGKHGELRDDRFAWLFGFSAGVMGGAYGMNGPPLVIYGSLRQWSPQHFRATLQGYFLPASLVGMWGYWLAGLWTPAVNQFYLLSLPFVILATLVGRVINRRMGDHRFVRYVYGGLIAIGIVLLSQALTGQA
ncbi:MAG TPA: sulfite exporter TauE/SafE family protein [Bryobacteraceae bacterium]|nr:sulfite exporter TauE/SafE family protein [Bryobacteraceae bacterium]